MLERDPFRDKCACAEVIQAWGLFRDQGQWNELLDTFTPEGVISISWFQGCFREFVDRCRARARSASKHLLFPSLVAVHQERALAETSVVMRVRRLWEGVEVDVTSNARFLDRLVRRNDGWKIEERCAIYERDRLDAVVPSPAFDNLLRSTDWVSYPPAYRFLAMQVAASGDTLAQTIYCDGMPETDTLRRRYIDWLGSPVSF